MKERFGERWSAYIVDLVFLFYLTDIISTLFFGGGDMEMILLNYREYAAAFPYIQRIVARFFLVFFVLSFLYFALEAFWGKALGKLMFGIKIDKSSLQACFFRGLIKAVVPLNAVDAIFLLKNGKRWSDHRWDTEVKLTGKVKTLSYLSAGIFLTYFPLLISLICYLCYGYTYGISAYDSMRFTSGGSFSVQFFKEVLHSNITFGILAAIKGSFGILPIMGKIAMQSNIQGKIMGGLILSGNGDVVLLKVVPHLPFEVLGIGSSLGIGIVITSMLINTIVSLTEEKRACTLRPYLRALAALTGTFLVFTLVGAFIEGYVSATM